MRQPAAGVSSSEAAADRASAEGQRSSRATLLRRGGFATLGLAAGGVVAGIATGPAASAASTERDAEILNFLLRLEYLQEALYAEALAAGFLGGELERFARVAGGHERAHVDALRRVLGRLADDPPRLDFGDAARREGAFAAAALTLEETAAAAYIGQAANLTRRRTTTVARIVSVEARHAAWIRDYVGRLPAPHAADPAKTPAQAQSTIARTGFVRAS